MIEKKYVALGIAAVAIGMGAKGCGTDAVVINETSVAALNTAEPTAGRIAENNLDHIKLICEKDVKGFVDGSQTIVQIGGSSAWSFCDYHDDNERKLRKEM